MAGLIHGIEAETVAVNLEAVRARVGDAVEILIATKYVPLEEMGRESVRIAMRHEDAFGRHAANEIIVGTHVVVRESVAPPRAVEL